jgi:homoserine O-acetyltransferase/O-succinyltransferase
MRARKTVIGAAAVWMLAALCGAAAAQDAAVKSYALGRFTFESGASIENAHVTYATWGKLNAAGDNAILLPSWYGGRATSYQFMIGPDRALDPARYFIVATEMFGSGGSSSPSNTPPPFDGPRFPRVAIRDDVEAARSVLRDGLGVRRLRAVVGFSMGAQQAFQWAVSHPDEVDSIVAICGTAKTYPHGRVRLQSAMDALMADPKWKGGDYTEPPADGLRAWAEHWAAWVYSQEWWRQELYKPRGPTIDAFLVEYVKGWNGRNLNDAVQLARTWQDHDIGRTKGFDGIESALRSIRKPVLYMPGATDLYFPVTDAQYERGFLSDVRFAPIPSIWGHTAGGGSNPADAAFLNREIGAFMAAPRRSQQ